MLLINTNEPHAVATRQRSWATVCVCNIRATLCCRKQKTCWLMPLLCLLAFGRPAPSWQDHFRNLQLFSSMKIRILSVRTRIYECDLFVDVCQERFKRIRDAVRQTLGRCEVLKSPSIIEMTFWNAWHRAQPKLGKSLVCRSFVGRVLVNCS